MLMLYREAYYLEKKLKGSSDDDVATRLIEKQNALEIILAKNRSGPCPTLDLWCDVASSAISQTTRGPR